MPFPKLSLLEVRVSVVFILWISIGSLVELTFFFDIRAGVVNSDVKNRNDRNK